VSDWEERFHDAIKEYLGVPKDAEIFLTEECDYLEGCPTCGGTYEWQVTVSWYETGPGPRGGKVRKRYKNRTFDCTLIEFMQQL
jgi:hypothetical protein